VPVSFVSGSYRNWSFTKSASEFTASTNVLTADLAVLVSDCTSTVTSASGSAFLSVRVTPGSTSVIVLDDLVTVIAPAPSPNCRTASDALCTVESVSPAPPESDVFTVSDPAVPVVLLAINSRYDGLSEGPSFTMKALTPTFALLMASRTPAKVLLLSVMLTTSGAPDPTWMLIVPVPTVVEFTSEKDCDAIWCAWASDITLKV